MKIVISAIYYLIAVTASFWGASATSNPTAIREPGLTVETRVRNVQENKAAPILVCTAINLQGPCDQVFYCAYRETMSCLPFCGKLDRLEETCVAQQSCTYNNSDGTCVYKPVADPPAPCFSGENLVSVRGKGDVRLDSVEIGDYVRSSGDLYSRVYGFGHRQSQLLTEYLKISFTNSSSRVLEVTSNHLIFSKGKTIAAGQVNVGDFLDGEDGESLLVMGIETVIRKGVYAPHTESGEIVVGGVRASNYVNLLHTSAIDQHTMSHALTAPWRFICKVNFDWCKQETYTKEGYSHYAKYFVWLDDILNQMGTEVLYLVTLLVSPVVGLHMLFEYIACHSLAVFGLLLATCGFVQGTFFIGKVWPAMEVSKH